MVAPRTVPNSRLLLTGPAVEDRPQPLIEEPFEHRYGARASRRYNLLNMYTTAARISSSLSEALPARGFIAPFPAITADVRALTLRPLYAALFMLLWHAAQLAR